MNPTYHVRETVKTGDGREAHYFVRGPFPTPDDAHAVRKELRLRLPRKSFHCVKVTPLEHEPDEERVIYPAWGKR